jgi:RNA polymerase sigma-70 factor (ECF subfamily)
VLLNFGIVRMYYSETSGAGFWNRGVSAPPLDVFHVCRPRGSAFYSINALVNFLQSLRNKFLIVSNPVQEKGLDVLDSQEQVRFETLVLPHLDAAFNLARWLLRSRADAEDAAQEALLRAYRFFHGFHGGDARAWLLQIVRNTCYTWLDKNRRVKDMTEFNEEVHGLPSPSPETLAIASNDRDRLSEALKSLPPRYREVIVLRELEGCSYKEIASITSIPIGTVMSTLSRARRQLQMALGNAAPKEATHGV